MTVKLVPFSQVPDAVCQRNPHVHNPPDLGLLHAGGFSGKGECVVVVWSLSGKGWVFGGEDIPVALPAPRVELLLVFSLTVVRREKGKARCQNPRNQQ